MTDTTPPPSDLASDGLQSALMGARTKQIVTRAVAAAAFNLAFTVGVEGRALSVQSLRAPLTKTAVSVTAADLASDFMIDNSAWSKAYGVQIPSVVFSEPIIAGLLQYLYERFITPNSRASFFTEFTVGAVASKVSDWAAKRLTTM